jgi:hypothetical protein
MTTQKTIVFVFTTAFLVVALTGVANAMKGKAGCCTFETKDELEISVDFQATCEKGIHKFTYGVTNLPTSQQALGLFDVIFFGTGVEIFGGTSSFGGKPAFPSPSTLSSGKRGKPARVGWAFFSRPVAPGQAAMFEFTSNAAPVVTDYYFEGKAASVECTCEQGGPLSGYSDLTPYGPGKVGKTLGPGTYPSNRHEYIVALKRQFDEARKLGWVRSTDAAKEIEEALGNIQTEMQRGLWYKTTIPVFQAKLKDMKNNKQINAETYYLLSVNLEVIAGK